MGDYCGARLCAEEMFGVELECAQLATICVAHVYFAYMIIKLSLVLPELTGLHQSRMWGIQ